VVISNEWAGEIYESYFPIRVVSIDEHDYVLDTNIGGYLVEEKI